MSSITDALDGLEAAVDALTELDWPTDHSVERLKAADRLETLLRRQRATAHRLIHHLDESALGAPAVIAISDLLRITRTEARRRLRDAEQLTPRTSLTGQPLPPHYRPPPPPGPPDSSTPNTCGPSKTSSATCPPTSYPPSPKKPKTSWPTRPHCYAPINSAKPPTPSPSGSTPTENSPTTTAPATADSPGPDPNAPTA